jgi:predicted ABC-type transport system involved in lysophospholipase L1 biosynthesis ATPase subunit
MHRRPTAVQVEWPRRRAHEGELGHAAHRGRERGVLEGEAHAAVGPVGAGASAALAFVALNCGLKIVGTGEVVQLALHRVQIFGVPAQIK